MIGFKEFLKKYKNEEYWGYSFAQEKDLVNGPAYREKGINSKYQGPGTRTLDTLDVDRMYGFDAVDKTKIDSKKMMKKKSGKNK